MVEAQENSFGKIQQYLKSKGFKYRTRDGEQLFQKGDGVWVAAKFIKVTYYNNVAYVEAWIDAMGQEQALEGFVGSAAKKPLKKIVAEVENILNQPDPNYIPAEATGEEISSAPPVQKVELPEGITKKEYFKKYAGESFYRDVKIAAIVAYICAGINAVVSLLAAPVGLIDSVIFLGLALGMHIAKSKACAIGMLAYSIFVVLVGLVINGAFGGWLWVVAGVTAAIVFRNAEKRYKELTNN